ncbi:TPM domain-containing protein [Rubrivirga sp.]|uniref:TPM domain-containing protein n=1 Tax=Rubrivirga sp. TaxID=1885344 RepID=UPI003B5248C6
MLRRLAVALLLIVASGVGAQDGRPYESRYDIPARPSPPRLVNDFTQTLSDGERQALERKLVAFADSTGSQVAVVLVRSTDGVASVDYATEILREWGVGRAGTDDGVVLLVATEDRELFITTGYGAEGALTDATAGTIVRNVIVPRFREGAFYAGIDQGTDAIVAALSGQFDAPTARVGAGGGDDAIGSVLCCLFVLFVVLVVIASRQQSPPSSGSSGGRRRRRRGPGIIVIPGGGWGGGGGGFGGFGGGGGGFGGGGFGGFGGGFGGGGGAGGSW